MERPRTPPLPIPQVFAYIFPLTELPSALSRGVRSARRIEFDFTRTAKKFFPS